MSDSGSGCRVRSGTTKELNMQTMFWPSPGRLPGRRGIPYRNGALFAGVVLLALASVPPAVVSREASGVSPTPLAGPASALAVSPNGKVLVGRDEQGLLRLWHVATGK